MPSFLLSWNDGVTASSADSGDFVVHGPSGRIALRRLNPHIVEALRQIESIGVEDDRLAELARNDGDKSLPNWYYYLDRLTRRGLLCHSAHERGQRLATLMAISPSYLPRSDGVVANSHYVLSRFAFLRREGQVLVVESPMAHARILINDCRTAALIASLAAPAAPAEFAQRGHGLEPASVGSILSLFLRAGMLQETDAQGQGSEDRDPSLQTWSFHDLLFQTRSRQGRFDAPYGGTFRFAGGMPQPAAIKPPMNVETIQLHRPDLDQLQRTDPPFAAVQEMRQSVREYDATQPISARQLGEFLFRVARVKQTHTSKLSVRGESLEIDIASRPYPSGGGLYEIEFYMVVQHCEGLDRGLYHYVPQGHLLERLPDRPEDATHLLRDAGESTATSPDELQILFVLAARVPRLAWKYESIAYALVLKHVGVIYQTMYLAATAMGLAPCAVGGGDSDLFARATGMDYATECSVGEFLLGSMRPELTDCDKISKEGELQCAITGNGH